MSFERISFPQNQAFTLVINVILALLLRYACVKQLFSITIFHISSLKIFPMICSYTNESPGISELCFRAIYSLRNLSSKFPVSSDYSLFLFGKLSISCIQTVKKRLQESFEG